MKYRFALAALAALGVTAGVAAVEMQTVFEEGFDRYGYDLAQFNDACTVAEAPASLKSLRVRPVTNEVSVYRKPCLTSFNYDGWHLISFPLTKASPVKIASPGENEWQWAHDGTGDRRITYPITLTGLAVEMPAKSLNILEMEDVPPVIRLKDLCTY